MVKESLIHHAPGVDYETLDPFKRAAQAAARSTASQLLHHNLKELDWSRGESAYLIQLPDGSVFAHVEEGLGTKNLVADAMECMTGMSRYSAVAQDTVAMIVNDMITLGVPPVSVAMHVAAGSEAWFKDARHVAPLIDGWRAACVAAGCAWGPGETPALKGVVHSNTVVLSGSALGWLPANETSRIIHPSAIRNNDAIVLLASSGINANGLTDARKIAERVPDNYAEILQDGRWYGEALLDPTRIYVPVVRACQKIGIPIHYAVNITGHGWRKLMRAESPFAYVIERVPEPQPVFHFMQEHGSVSDKEAYATWNMGAGFALYVAPEDVSAVITASESCGIPALHAGHITYANEKKVVIIPKNIVYESSSLAIR